MRRTFAGIGHLALIVAVLAASAVPAAAEFFGCNDQRPHRTFAASTHAYSVPYRSQSSRGYTHEFAASRSPYAGRTYRSSANAWR